MTSECEYCGGENGWHEDADCPNASPERRILSMSKVLDWWVVWENGVSPVCITQSHEVAYEHLYGGSR